MQLPSILKLRAFLYDFIVFFCVSGVVIVISEVIHGTFLLGFVTGGLVCGSAAS
jgi:hypothetical protein